MIEPLLKEAEEILKIIAASLLTLKGKNDKPNTNKYYILNFDL